MNEFNRGMKIDDALNELEQITALLGLVQTAFAEGASVIPEAEASIAIYYLYTKQLKALETLRSAEEMIQEEILTKKVQHE